MMGPGQNIDTIPKSMKRIIATKSTPLRTVKSNFVCNANNVNAKQRAAVAPTASNTVSGGTADVNVPNINDWANVNKPRNMKFVGDVRRTPSQQAIAIIVTISTAKATQNNSRWLLKNCFVPWWYTQRQINANDTLNWTWINWSTTSKLILSNWSKCIQQIYHQNCVDFPYESSSYTCIAELKTFCLRILTAISRISKTTGWL